MPWRALLPADPVPWILASPEPWARLLARTRLLDEGPDLAPVQAERAAVRAHPLVRELVARLPDWEQPTEVSGHNHPLYAPNLHSAGLCPQPKWISSARAAPFLRGEDASPRTAGAPPSPRPIGARACGA